MTNANKLTTRKAVYVLFLDKLNLGVCTVKTKGVLAYDVARVYDKDGSLVEQLQVHNGELCFRAKILKNEQVVDRVYASHNKKKLQRKLAFVRNAWKTAFGVDLNAGPSKKECVFERASRLRASGTSRGPDRPERRIVKRRRN